MSIWEDFLKKEANTKKSAIKLDNKEENFIHSEIWGNKSTVPSGEKNNQNKTKKLDKFKSSKKIILEKESDIDINLLERFIQRDRDNTDGNKYSNNNYEETVQYTSLRFTFFLNEDV